MEEYEDTYSYAWSSDGVHCWKNGKEYIGLTAQDAKEKADADIQ